MLVLRDKFRFPNMARTLADPFREFDRWTDSLLGEGDGLRVSVDIRHDDSGYTITADVPGFKQNDLDITLEDSVLTISGERKAEEKQEGETYFVVERRAGRFSRCFRLPSDVKTENIEANLRDGILTIKLEKVDEVKPRRIEVKAN